MLGADFFVFLLVMVIAIGLLFMMVWHVSGTRNYMYTQEQTSCICFLQLIMVDELKNDYRNPVDFSSNLNMV